jgi:hypothetical protein
VIAIQEPDATSWQCYPAHPAWERLKDAILAAFARGGGDFNAGQRTFGMLRCAGLEDVQIRAAVVALRNTHPYKPLPIQFATSLRKRIVVEGRILSEAELDNAIAACEQIASDPEMVVMSFIVTQEWGGRPATDGKSRTDRGAHQGHEPTAYSLRCASASGSGSCPALTIRYF